MHKQEKEIYLTGAGYPTKEVLNKIKTWKVYKAKDCHEILEFIKKLWYYPKYITVVDDPELGKAWHISTGGWSGNEEIIGALMDNHVFWAISWYSSKRGGHYIFGVKPWHKGREK
jgi:hypothetical protein